MKVFQVSLMLCFLYQNGISYKILGILPVPSKSHYYIGHSLLKGLALEGHDVTVMSPFKEEKPIKNYKEVLIENVVENWRKVMAKHNFLDWGNTYFWNTALKYYEMGVILTNWTVSSKNVKEFIKIKQHFDVVVAEVGSVEAIIAFGNYNNAPVVALSTFGASKATTDLVGTPNFASYVPCVSKPYTDRMTFWQRMQNSLCYWFSDLVYPLYVMPKQQKLMEKLFPVAKNWPSLEEMRRNVSLVLLNTHTTLGTPRPYTPNMIEVGGMQIPKNIEPLPPKIQKFLDEAVDGAIFVSLGSNVLITKLPEHQYNAIVNAFKPYSNVRILIKSDENVIIPSHKQSDVLVEPWFNQQSILAHRNCKLFLTHGGLLSTTEAVHFGKPVVGIPFFFDQPLNMKLAEQKGFGISVPIETLNAENIATAVNKVLSVPSYAENAKLISDRFRDQPRSPLETAIHWVKHVAKNKGAPHLRSVAVDLPFYKLYNLDVWAFIFGVIAFSVFLIRKILNFAFSFIFDSKTKQKSKRE
ncbi:UDP-glucuronosyltransferase 2C1-like [Contarinia nasturtii]|uniref:UDP-glucuronosyltransferase 2C1-like n=1 Tax=Contarinia nasturtii TaxID=265458 RepID=UPI0012D4320D|nr:UDP-glucuronosyltransferase 2C1-like [Contarinia nasturtii]